MNKEIGQEWVRRLESGEYEQGTGFLRKADGYCCLGVLCEMAVEAGVTSRRTMAVTIGGSPYHEYGVGDDENWNDQFLPNEVRDWAGLISINPEVSEDGALSRLNDIGRTFPDIAKLIRTHLLDPEPIPA